MGRDHSGVGLRSSVEAVSGVGLGVTVGFKGVGRQTFRSPCKALWLKDKKAIILT